MLHVLNEELPQQRWYRARPAASSRWYHVRYQREEAAGSPWSPLPEAQVFEALAERPLRNLQGGGRLRHVAAAAGEGGPDLLGRHVGGGTHARRLVEEDVERGPGDPQRLRRGLEVPPACPESRQKLVLRDLGRLA